MNFQDLKNARARLKHEYFMEHTWQDLSSPFKVGIHTKILCARIDKAMEDFRNGKSTFLVVNMPFRHGKSVTFTQTLPPHFNGEFPDCETLTLTHSADLSYDFSKACRNLIQTKEYNELYPSVQIDPKNKSVKGWGVQKLVDGEWQTANAVNRYFGIQGGVAGRGGKLVIVDDLYKTRRDAESETVRGTVLNEFRDGVFTRRSDPAIIILVSTRWHVDDVTGWLKEQVEKDKDFPEIDFINFPGISDKYETGTLFPEVFSKTWYDSQRKVLGTYAFNSLMQGEPSHKGNLLFKVDYLEDGTHLYNKSPMFRDITWSWGWDLASTEKQTQKEDPDYTVGIRLGLRWVKLKNSEFEMLELYIDDMVRGQWEAPKRNLIIKNIAARENTLPVNIESVAGYKDCYTEIKAALLGIAHVNKITASTDKISKSGILTPIFEAKNVFMKRASWNEAVIKELSSFPSGKHDDIFDAIIAAMGNIHGKMTCGSLPWQ